MDTIGAGAQFAEGFRGIFNAVGNDPFVASFFAGALIIGAGIGALAKKNAFKGAMGGVCFFMTCVASAFFLEAFELLPNSTQTSFFYDAGAFTASAPTAFAFGVLARAPKQS